MSRIEELNNFLTKADDLISCKYILAESKMIALLKSIAASETIVAIMESALYNFDYKKAKEKYFCKSRFGSDNRGDFVLPENTKEMIALIFNLLLEIDGKKVNFSDFLQEYFDENGSFSESYTIFVNRIIRPFKNAVKLYMEGVIEGKIKNPKDELKLIKTDVTTKQISQTLSVEKEPIERAKKLIEEEKGKVLVGDATDEEKAEVLLILENFLRAIDDSQKPSIRYAFICYKMTALAYKRFGFSVEKVFACLAEGRVL